MNKRAKGVTVWFTGLSGAGKTTVALEVERQLEEKGYYTQRLDGDIVREKLTKDLGFTKEDRNKNIERNTFVAKILTDNDVRLYSRTIPNLESTQEVNEAILAMTLKVVA